MYQCIKEKYSPATSIFKPPVLMQLQVAAEKEGNLYKLTTLKEGIASMSTL
jgi:hypothetical protein